MMKFTTAIIISIAAGSLMFASSTNARKKETFMPMLLIGEWCYADRNGKEINYTLPSWSEGACKNILSITPWSFRSADLNCNPKKVRQKKDCAPSGCAYDTIVVASCWKRDGPSSFVPNTDGKLRTFKFHRYKGNVYITEK